MTTSGRVPKQIPDIMNTLFQKIKSFTKVFSESNFFIPIVLLFFTFFSYGLFIHRLGFYWDDWPYLYLNHSQGVLGYPEYMSTDRPFSAWVFMLVGSLFKENALGYHLYVLIIRWAGAYALWRVMGLIWPKNTSKNLIVALLFLVYPGFLQQPISLIYSLHLTVLALFLISLGLMLLAIRQPKHYTILTLLGLICSLGIFSSEYFALLEFLRPVLLWKIGSEHLEAQKKRVIQVFRFWLPYLIILILFLTWRVFIFKFPTYQLEILKDLFPLNSISFFSLITQTVKDFFTVNFTAWANIFFPSNLSRLDSMGVVLWLSISAFSALSTWFLLRSFEKKHSRVESHRSDDILLLGLCAIVLAGIPIWVTGLPIELNFAWDRLTLPFALGAGLFLTGIFEKLIRNNALRRILFSLLIGFSTGYHLLNTFSYIKDWEALNSFFWQLKWRAPGLMPGTTILTDDFPLKYYSDNSLTAPLNWIYDENNRTLNLNFMFYFIEVRLGRRLPALKKDLVIDQPYRSFSFVGSTSNMVALFFHPPACLRITDREVDAFNQGISKSLKETIHLSNMDLITPNNDTRLPKIFFQEPTHDWCYYYEKADLARQQEDWIEITNLGEQILHSKEKPFDLSEYFPFIEGYANRGQWDISFNLSREIHRATLSYAPMICALWERILSKMPLDEIPQEASNLFYSELKCLQK